MRSHIMYIDNKSEALNSRGRIGRVTFSKSGKTIHYRDKSFLRFKGGYKCNYLDVASGEKYWISGPKKMGGDRLYGQPGVEIDEDVRVEYWINIRQQPNRVHEATT